jgi:hypothetical protein
MFLKQHQKRQTLQTLFVCVENELNVQIKMADLINRIKTW